MGFKLAEKAMLVNLHISQWTARKYDRKVSKDVAVQHNTTSDAGRYNKVLIARNSIESITKLVSTARMFHYENTLPWQDDGARLLPSKNYFEYTSKIRMFKAQFEYEVDSFLANYEIFKEDARKHLNGMFKESDYPKMNQLVIKYEFIVSVDPIAMGEDFRVDIQAEEVERIRADVEKRLIEAQRQAMGDLWNRLYESVEKMASKLSERDAIFRDTLVGNVQEIVKLLPRLNFAEDENLNWLGKEVEARLCGFNPDDLRKHPIEREIAARDASQILDAMKSYMGKENLKGESDNLLRSRSPQHVMEVIESGGNRKEDEQSKGRFGFRHALLRQSCAETCHDSGRIM